MLRQRSCLSDQMEFMVCPPFSGIFPQIISQDVESPSLHWHLGVVLLLAEMTPYVYTPSTAENA